MAAKRLRRSPPRRSAGNANDRDGGRTQERERTLDAHIQQRFKRVVEGVPVAIVAVDRRGTIVLANSLAERLFRYVQDELLGKSVETLVPERFRRDHGQYRAAFSDSPQMRQMGAGRDLYGLRNDGSEIPIEIGLNPIELDGEMLVLASIVDITERKRLLEAERQARSEADAANRSKDLFLARVSHELRTPLNALVGWARMLRNGQLPSDKVTDAIASIDRNGEVLKTLVEDLVEMSRVTTGKLDLDRKRTDIGLVLRESMTLLEATANAKEITLETDVGQRPIIVDADPTRLRQVFWNLLSNAVKFTPTGGRVTLHVRRLVGEVEINVIDTGRGIAPEFLPHVFEALSQEDKGGQGLGLGLAIARQFVEAHDGRIRVTSQGAGAGATFTVILPLAPVPESV